MSRKLDAYINKCVEDAYKSEGRELCRDTVCWFYLVVDKQMLFQIRTPYQRVSHKISFRLNNNVEKNFGLSASGDYWVSKVMQPNFVCNRFTLNGKNMFLCKDYMDVTEGTVIGSGRYEKLCMAYHNVTIDEFAKDYESFRVPFDISWKDYREVYKRAFETYPEVDISDFGSNRHIVLS